MRIYYMRCSLETSLKRNKDNGSTQNISMLKRLHTASENIYNEYKDKLDFYVLDTNGDIDYRTIKLKE